MHKKIILASSSPRRIELLKKAGINFEVQHSNYEEVNPGNLEPKDLAMLHSKEKAMDIFKQNQDAIVIGADTIVVHNGKVFEKPGSKEGAYEMLKELSGTNHSVITGYTIISKEKTITDYAETKIFFKNIPDSILREYAETGRGLDKSGSYSIQDPDYKFVEKYEGDFDNVVGLPTSHMLESLRIFFNI